MKKRKQALFHSIIALLLCVSMLMGTTFAWFTDGVSSGKNSIVAGNLDVELEYLDAAGNWQTVTEATNVFEENTLWEPGHTEVVYLKVSNLGTLALKYQLGVNIAAEAGSVNVNGEAFVLSDYIEFAAIEGVKEAYADRDAARAAVTDAKILSTGYTREGTMLAGDAPQYVAFVVYMPETVGNEANYRTGEQPPRIDLGVSLFATQFTSESDSFGNDYDYAAGFPEVDLPDGGKTNVEVVDGTTSGTVTISGNAVSAEVPAGVAVNEGTTELTLSVAEMSATGSNITLADSEVLKPVDIHVEGVSADNTQPITVTLKSFAAIGLNEGNLKLYHVENGVTNAMTRVDSVADFTAHNQFAYDPATGDVTLYMATFSEVTAVADVINPWKGTVATAFGGGDGTEADPYLIANADQLAYMGHCVSNDNANYGSAWYKLISDVNIGGVENYETNGRKVLWYPIGYNKVGGTTTDKGDWNTYGGSFKGIFDGTGHTVTGIYQNTWAMVGDYSGTYYNDAMGLFGYVNGGTVKNLTIDNFYSEGEFAPTGCVAAYAAGDATFENIAITNSHPQTYNTGVAGIVGWDNGGDTEAEESNFTFQNITIDASNTISALWGSWDVAAAGLLGYLGEYSKANLVNCHVAATIDVYNDVCGNYQYYWYRYCGMMIGTVDKTKADGSLDLSNITAINCTVNFGDRHEYYYCEFEKNTQASYTEDFQFSRVDHSELNMSTTPVTCTHTHTANEDKQAVHIPFRQLFGGYGWGVDGVDQSEYENIEISDVTNAQEKFKTKFTGDFLYRVGNLNTVSVGSLFAAKSEEEDFINNTGVYVSIDKVDENTNVSGVFSNENKDGTTAWTEATIQFAGTGVVKVTIQDYSFCKPTELYLEVVDAYNRTNASFTGNSVLLNDVSTSSAISTSGVLYGNGFTINMENAPISEKNGAAFHLYDGAVLKNVSIVGKEFQTVAMSVNDTNYGVSAVRAWGTVVIENCYISGCRSAVSVTGTELTINDSVIANGVYANVDFRSGTLNLHNVTTINEPHTVDGTTIVGLGIVGNMTASAGRKLNITGTLTQYNWVSEADCDNIKASGVSSIFNSVFSEDKYASLRYTYNGTKYVNTGILSLCDDFGASAVTGIPSYYSGMDVDATISNVSVSGYVWAPAQAGTLSATDMAYHDTVYVWTASDQATSYVPPDFDFSNTGLEAENGVVQISYESGNSYTLSADTIKELFPAKKYGQALSVRVSMDGKDYTNSDIIFDTTSSQTYTITYTVTDNLVYDETGTLTGNTYEVTKDLKVFVTVVDKSADAPIFTFYYGTNGSASAGTPHTTQPASTYTSTIEQIGDAYYIMPNVNSTTDNAIGSQIVDGEKVYYPIVDGINVRSGNSTDYDFTRYYPIFKAVVISDNGTEYSYNTLEMPDTVAWVEATIDTGNGASALNDGFSLYNNQYLCRVQTKAGNAESGGTSVVKFSYTALDGNTYYYYVGYRFYDEDEGGACVTPDTLITLADGSQKRMDQVTYEDELLVWNFYNGEYTVMPAAALINHGYGNYRVISLKFSDGTVAKTITEHGFFDATTNKWAFINEENVASFVGHEFEKSNGDGFDTVKLIGYSVKDEYTESYSILSAGYNNVIVEGMLSLTPLPGVDSQKFFDALVIGKSMTYDQQTLISDSKKYGLYTYEDFADYITYEQFEAVNAKYLKIIVGKGGATFEQIIEMITAHVPN